MLVGVVDKLAEVADKVVVDKLVGVVDKLVFHL